MTKSIQLATAAILCIAVALTACSFLLYEFAFRRELKTLAHLDPPSATSLPANVCAPAQRVDSASELQLVQPLLGIEEHIADQIARSTLCSAAGQKRLQRQLHEIELALQIRLHFNHQEQVDIYLNRAYFGDGAYGIEQAARHYCGVPVANLTLSQAALLVGLIRSPNFFSPYRHPDRALVRRNAVLQNAYGAGRISQSDLVVASASPLGVRSCILIMNVGTLPGMRRTNGTEESTETLRQEASPGEHASP